MKGKTEVVVSLDNIRYNIGLFRNYVGKKKIMQVVKSNAYGHGIKSVAFAGKDLVDYFGVDDLDEALLLRKIGIVKPILVFGYVPEDRVLEAVENDISLTVSNEDFLKKVVEYESIKVHVKIDTGLHRQGFTYRKVERIGEIVEELGDRLVGLYTHYANAEDDCSDYTDLQNKRFSKVLDSVELPSFVLVHTSGSAGILVNENRLHDMVRLGIMQYGLWPSEEIWRFVKKNIGDFDLRPALRWESVISEVNEVPFGEMVGYGCDFITKRDSKLAVVPVGYWHGVPRQAKDGFVSIGGQKARIVGNVSMDMMVIDVTDIEEARRGDIVELIGDTVTADMVADYTNTLNYEVVTRINPLIIRRYVYAGPL